MRRREQAVVQTFRRIRDFVSTHRTVIPTYVSEKLLPRLDATIELLNELAVEQELGMRLQMAATLRQEALAKTLRDMYVVPLSRIARELSERGLAGLRAPHKRIPRARLVTAARGMAAVADRRAGVVEGYLGRGFLRGMRAAATALERAIIARDVPVRRHMVARARVEQALRAGRGTVRHMNALVEPVLSGDTALATTWRKMKRYE